MPSEKLAQEGLKKSIHGLKLVQLGEKADKWFHANKESMMDKLEMAEENYSGEDEKEKARHTLLPKHGVDQLY